MRKETTMNTQNTRRLAAATMAAAALGAIAGFTALGSVFQYPQILKSPTAAILDLYRQHQGAVMAWFLVLTISTALLAPAGILLGPHPHRRAPVGDLARLHLRRPDRHRRPRPARTPRRHPDQLRRLRRLVPVAHRHGRHPLAYSARHPGPPDLDDDRLKSHGHRQPLT